MRIACLHIPQFALQCATRLDPSLRGVPVAVVSGADAAANERVLRAPIVVACSRAAWTAGVRLGMTASAARSRVAGLAVVSLAPEVERETVRALGDALGAIARAVDLGTHAGPASAHYAIYLALPVGTRGQAFGERALAIVDELGIQARIGIADDRFTAWVAAAHATEGTRDVVSVPRGGAAAFLAPRPLSLLAIAPEVQHMLEALGVTTLGEFARLPAPSVARPDAADYQALARGDGGAMVRAYVPNVPIREDAVITASPVLAIPGALSGVAAIALVSRRLALRLAGRGRAAAQLEVHAGADRMRIELARPACGADELARALAPALIVAPAAAAWRLAVEVAAEAAVGEVASEALPARDALAAATELPAAVMASRAAEPVACNPLAMVLASTGVAELHAWSLQPPDTRMLRRDVHRRVRPARRRSRIEPVQPRLFDRRTP
jgi:hypothetical protein